MFDMRLDRRQFFGGALALGATAALPAWARDRAASTGWPLVDAMLDGAVGPNKVACAVGGVARGLDQAVFHAAGTLAFDSPVAVGPDTLFRLYSQTKPVTGIAAMLLVEDGKIGLDQDIADFIPGFKNPRVLVDPDKSLESRPADGPIIVRNLLTHTAGLGYSIVTKGPLLEQYNKLGILPAQVSKLPLPGFPTYPTAPSLEEFANRLSTLPLIADPGAKWSYSVSLDLLGRVIELASGKSFDAFLAERLFGPLGMTSTWFQVPAGEVRRLTTNYAQTPVGPIPIDPAATSIYLEKPPFAFGGAGMVSTPRDYDRFLAMLMGEGALGRTRIMKTETARLAMSNLVHEKTEMTGFVAGHGFGAGGRVSLKDMPGGSGAGTFGWGGAASTTGWVDRARGLRAGGYTQIFVMAPEQPFVAAFQKAVYASL